MGQRSATTYGVLGPLEAARDGVVVGLTRAQRAMVAALVIGRQRPVSIDLLADAVWDDDVPPDPAAALRSHVSRLRRALGTRTAEVVTTDGGYRLDVDRTSVDACRFEDLLLHADGGSDAMTLEVLDESLALWRGHAFEEFADRPFARAEAARLEGLRLDAIERRADHLLRLGRAVEAAASLAGTLDAHPEREHSRELLMTALYATGRHTEALALYSQWRRHLADELGLEPSPRLRELEMRILTHALPEKIAMATGAASPFDRDPAALPTNAPNRPPPPRPVSSFVGRERELAAILEALSGTRLLTLTGPGGVGKTRLALEVAARAAHHYLHGVVFCDLASIRRSADVPRALATVLRFRDHGRVPLTEQLIAGLTAEHILLILDNCEHVLDGAAPLVEALTQRTASLQVLATSRERLAADGERTIVVEPLAVDRDGPAVGLFVARGEAAGWSGRDDPVQLLAVEALCRRLDGLPLAIELAAARAGAIAVDELAAGLAERSDLLVSGHRTNERHRSLRAVMDWTYARLTPEERSAFELLCTTNSPFDLEQARSLLRLGGVEGAEVPPLIVRLVESSLLACQAEPRANRYVLLETLRAYGIERLGERGTLDHARTRHANWVARIVERATRTLCSEQEKAAAEELDRMIDEMRAAQTWLVGHDPAAALWMADALHGYAFWRGRAEVFRWAQVAAAADPASPRSAAVMASACAGAWLRGDLPAARALLQGALVAARDADPPQARRVVQQVGELALLEGRLDEAASAFGEAARLSVQADDPIDASWNAGSRALALAYAGLLVEATNEAERGTALAGQSRSPSARAFAEFVHGEIDALLERSSAEAHLRAAIDLAESVDNDVTAGLARVTLATMKGRDADTSTALAEYLAVIRTWQRAEAWTSQWVTLRNLVALLVRCGSDRDAAVLHAATVQTRTGAPAYGRDQALLDAVQRHLDEVLTAAERDELYARGRALCDEEVVDVAIAAIQRARSEPSPSLAGDRPRDLAPRAIADRR